MGLSWRSQCRTTCLIYLGMINNGGAGGVAEPGNNVNHPGRKARLLNQLGHVQTCPRDNVLGHSWICNLYICISSGIKAGHPQFKSTPPQLRNIADNQIHCGVAD
jgi:hypothetical protein